MLPLKERMQKISNNLDNCLGKDRTESDSYQGVQTFIGITENNLTEVHLGQGKLLELIRLLVTEKIEVEDYNLMKKEYNGFISNLEKQRECR